MLNSQGVISIPKVEPKLLSQVGKSLKSIMIPPKDPVDTHLVTPEDAFFTKKKHPHLDRQPTITTKKEDI